MVEGGVGKKVIVVEGIRGRRRGTIAEIVLVVQVENSVVTLFWSFMFVELVIIIIIIVFIIIIVIIIIIMIIIITRRIHLCKYSPHFCESSIVCSNSNHKNVLGCFRTNRVESSHQSHLTRVRLTRFHSH